MQLRLESYYDRSVIASSQPMIYSGRYTITKDLQNTSIDIVYSSGPMKRARFIVPLKYAAFWPPEVIRFSDRDINGELIEIDLHLVNVQ
jgi:hypothetical protein